MQVVTKFVSELGKVLKQDLEYRKVAQVEGLRAAANGLKRDLQSVTAGSGLGRLSKAWGAEAYPRKGNGSLSAAAEVFVKGNKHTQDAMWAFSHGATITSRHGKFLLIPTANAPRQGQRASRDEKAGGRYSRDKVLAAAEARYGKLRFVYRRGQPSLLVADNVRARAGKRGGFARASGKAIVSGYTSTIVVFFLVPIARLQKRFDVPALERKWRSRIPGLIAAEYRSLSGGR